jgi:hypothetical protein
MKTWKVVLAFILIPAVLIGQGLPIKGGATSDLANVNVNKALEVVQGDDATATYILTTTNAAITAAGSDVLSLEAGASQGFKITKLCVYPGSATAAAIVQWQLIRTTTASSGGTVIAAEVTSGNNSLSKADPADANWSGVARAPTATEGTSGAILDNGMAHVAITATPPTTFAYFCREYGLMDGKGPIVVPGTTNGVKLMWEGTAGGVDLGAAIHFIAYP